MAIVETLVAVVTYWWVIVHYDAYAPLLISAAVMPLVLLRFRSIYRARDKAVQMHGLAGY